MAPGSAAVELFPFHFDHTLYSGMAALMGVGMYPAHATNGSLVYATDKVRFAGCGCCGMSCLCTQDVDPPRTISPPPVHLTMCVSCTSKTTVTSGLPCL